MATAYLTRNTGGTGTSGKKFTISFWMKCADTSNSITMFSASSNATGSPFMLIQRTNVGRLRFSDYTNSTTTRADKTTTRLLRDPASFYHIVIAVDTDQSTASERNRIYINGVEETSFSTDTNYSSGATTSMGQNNEMVIGRYEPYNSNYFDGLITHFHYADGQQYAPTVFGETDSTSGIWKPKTSPSVTYGTNGFFLDFEDSSALGDDESGNTNDFTVNGTITQTEDTPSNNFATLNPLQSNLSLTNGNLQATTTNYKYGVSTLAVSSGKWYVEMKVTDPCMVMGIQDMIKANDGLRNTAIFWSSGSESYHLDGFSKFTHDSYGDISSNASDYPTYANGDIIGMAIDLDNNKLQYSKNGTWYKSADPANGTNMETIDASSTLTSGNYGIVVADACGASDGTFYMNFGNGYFGTTAVSSSNSDSAGLGLFEYSVPSGYYALCTKNIKNYG